MPKKNSTIEAVTSATEKGSRELDAMLGAYLCLCTLDHAARIRVIRWLQDALADYCRMPADEPPF